MGCRIYIHLRSCLSPSDLPVHGAGLAFFHPLVVAYQSLKADVADLIKDQLGVHIQHEVDEVRPLLHELWITEIAITATSSHLPRGLPYMSFNPPPPQQLSLSEIPFVTLLLVVRALLVTLRTHSRTWTV